LDRSPSTGTGSFDIRKLWKIDSFSQAALLCGRIEAETEKADP
jgi:hypothetical protein